MVNGDSGSQQLLETLRSIDTQTIVIMFLILAAAYVLSRIITTLLSKISEKMSRKDRIKVKMIIPTVKFGIYVLAFYYILKEIFNIFGPELLLLTGLLGAAIGFGVKDLFADIIGGLVITFEKPYQIGDKISIGGHYGEVTDIGLRATKMVTPDDNTITAPNSLIFNETVASGNYGDSEMMVVIDLYIASGSNVETAMRILREAVVSSKYVYISESSPVTLLHKALPFYTMLRAKAYVNDLRDEFKFESDVHTRTWIEFLKNGIRAPQFHILNLPPAGKKHESDAPSRRNARSNTVARRDSEFNADFSKNFEF
ncbi:Potassium efflux system KefA protein [Methanosarcina siciliae C2J]|uniref:Potassium efflux system KefA protein n=2 Tax=Methanosarcina siciliae TaxID=38027 RepID=A0A0E3L8W9_9EURY|nr:mechanosensitive ion channel domain-containing protein [Methanosarcina siciliae]AKB29251.1 Potassium efflux system KefA protein [Methanosarcina siciliae T4/M]AKB37422.1 Potassium efflux system KefA protein [Methanosarcina siciliae C2J]